MTNSSLKRLSPVIRSIFTISIFISLLIGFGVLIHQFTQGNTLGYDFFYYWNSTRAFIRDGLNPYSTEVAIQNQIGLYGHPGQPGDDPSFFRNPIYAIIPIFPFALLPFEWAQAFWMAINIFIILISCFIAFPEMPKWKILLYIFFYQITFGLIMGNFSILSGSILVLCIGLLIIQEKRDQKTQVVLGILLAFATLKPQLSWFFIFWIIIFSFREKLFPLIVSLFLTLISLSLVMMCFIPSWPLDFVRLLFSYQKDANLVPVRTALFGLFFEPSAANFLGIFFLFITIVTTLYLIFSNRSFSKQKSLVQLSFIGITTFISHPSGFSNEQVCLLIPILAWMALGIVHEAMSSISWIFMFFLSYIFFFLEKSAVFPQAILWGPLLISLFWTGLLVLLYRKQVDTNKKELTM